MPGIVPTTLFCLLMVVVMIGDVGSMTIPNWISVTIVVSFPAFAAISGVHEIAILAHMMTGLLVLCATASLFALGWMGGGDAKLIAATALWFGPGQALADYVLQAALIGGVLALLFLGLRAAREPDTGVAFVDRLLDRTAGIPYGVALSLAAISVELTALAAGPLPN